MKWFKHDTTALHDAKVEKLIMKYGIEGYGLYFACVEIIAGSLSPDNFTFELEHDAEILAHKFQVDTLKIQEMMKYTIELGLFEVNGDNKITCLKLAKRLDNTMSQNPELKRTLSNFKQLQVCARRLDKTRLDKTRVREDNTMSGKPDDTPAKTAKAKQETEKVNQVIAYLNKRAGTHFRPNAKAHQTPIRGRLREGSELEDFKRAIVWCVSEWQDDAEMERFIRPETIFRASKFEGYVENFYRKQRRLDDE